jgi:curved DNA-binding protein CbpA
MTTTHYDTLQVSPRADWETIKAAYHRAALQYHPDKQPGATTEFRRIQVAWECLREDRKAYDEQLRLRRVQSSSRVNNALSVRKEDCTGPECVLDEEGQEVMVWYFTCRCGHEMDIEVGESEPVDCPGCSLLYDITSLQDSSSNS